MSKILEAITIGILFGLLTHVANKYLPSDLHFLVDTKIIWLLPAFLIAFNLPSRYKQHNTIFIATLTLFITGFTYYSSELVKHYEAWYLSTDLAEFLCLGLFAGIITGIVAYLGRTATNQLIRYGSASLLPAIYTGDGLNEIIKTLKHFEFTPEIGFKVLGGMLFYFLIAGRHRFKVKSLLAYLALTAVAALVYLYML